VGLLGRLDSRVVRLLLGGVLSDEGVVLGNGLLLGQSPPLAQAPEVPLPLQPHRSDETLDLGSLGVWLGTLLLRDDFTPDDKLPNVILLAQVEESPDLGGTLGTETLGENVIGETWDLLFTLLDDDDGENGDIGVDDATTDGLALTFTGSTSSVARVTVSQEETGSLGEENTLLHWETLLVVTTGDAENVTLPLGTQGLSGNVVSHLLLDEWTPCSLGLDLESLLLSSDWVCYVELHLDELLAT